MTANLDMSQFVDSRRLSTSHQRTCTVCGKVFMAMRHQALYCSPRCKQAVLLRRRHEVGRRHRHRRCPRCGNVFVVRRSDGMYCSNACRQAVHRLRHRVEG
jgi:ribosomal protein S27AE